MLNELEYRQEISRLRGSLKECRREKDRMQKFNNCLLFLLSAATISLIYVVAGGITV